MNIYVVIIIVMVWRSFAVKGFWALCVNIYECVCCKRCHGVVIIYCQGILSVVC
jgi:hypothetical protein